MYGIIIHSCMLDGITVYPFRNVFCNLSLQNKTDTAPLLLDEFDTTNGSFKCSSISSASSPRTSDNIEFMFLINTSFLAFSIAVSRISSLDTPQHSTSLLFTFTHPVKSVLSSIQLKYGTMIKSSNPYSDADFDTSALVDL